MSKQGQEVAGRRERIRLLIELGRPKEALRLIYRLRGQSREQGDEGAEVAELEGLALIRMDDWDAAQRALLDGLRLTPHRAHLHYLKFFADRGKNDLKAAGESLREALRLAAEEPVYLRAHAEHLSEQKAHLPAIEQARLAVHHGPDRAQNHVTLGYVLSSAGDKKAARRSYDKALELDPDDATAWNNLGCLDMEEGNTPGARERFRESLRLYPEGPRALKNLAQTLTGRTEEGFVRWDDWVRGLAEELVAVDELALLLALAFEAEAANTILWMALKKPGRARGLAALAGVSMWTVLALVRLGGGARLAGAGLGIAASLGSKRWFGPQRQRLRDELRYAKIAFEVVRRDWLDGRTSRAARDAAARRLVERVVLCLRQSRTNVPSKDPSEPREKDPR
ncbi:MAG: tetratricopeptide repeat protein [Polyangia bacterium]